MDLPMPAMGQRSFWNIQRGQAHVALRGRVSIQGRIDNRPHHPEYDIITISNQEAVMGQLIVRNLEDEVVATLKTRAAAHGRSAEAEHREILRHALCAAPSASGDWFDRARALRSRLHAPDGDTTDILRADRDRDATARG